LRRGRTHRRRSRRLDLIAELARELGFHRAAIVPIEPPRRYALYESWLAAGHAGGMAYLAADSHTAPRRDLRALLRTARSLVVVALAYDRADPAEPAPLHIGRADPIPPRALLRGRIARYARGEASHLVMR